MEQKTGVSVIRWVFRSCWAEFAVFNLYRQKRHILLVSQSQRLCPRHPQLDRTQG